MIEGSVGGLLTSNNIGRVDQLEDRYLGMVEAPSSNLGVSTPLTAVHSKGVATLPQTCSAVN